MEALGRRDEVHDPHGAGDGQAGTEEAESTTSCVPFSGEWRDGRSATL
ncbi:hypothetical protein [Streptomyces sp. NPDC057579]